MDIEEIYARIKYDQMGLCEFEDWYRQAHTESWQEGYDEGKQEDNE